MPSSFAWGGSCEGEPKDQVSHDSQTLRMLLTRGVQYYQATDVIGPYWQENVLLEIIL